MYATPFWNINKHERLSHTKLVKLLQLLVLALLPAAATGLAHDADPFPGVHRKPVGDCADSRKLACGSTASTCAHDQTEYWGEVVVAGDAHLVESAAECCRACEETRGCNTFVWCSPRTASHSHACAKQCWLKWQPNPRTPEVRGHGHGTPWVSGALLKDYHDPALHKQPPPVPLQNVTGIVLHTDQGDIRVRLRADWAPESVRYVAELVARDACSAMCQFYRAEAVPPNWAQDGFYGPPYALLQGGLKGWPGAVPANKGEAAGYKSRPGYPPIVRAGMVAWAGSEIGPDFFISMGEHEEWGLGHCAWGELADPESMRVAERVNSLPTKRVQGGVVTQILLKPSVFTTSPILG